MGPAVTTIVPNSGYPRLNFYYAERTHKGAQVSVLMGTMSQPVEYLLDTGLAQWRFVESSRRKLTN